MAHPRAAVLALVVSTLVTVACRGEDPVDDSGDPQAAVQGDKSPTDAQMGRSCTGNAQCASKVCLFDLWDPPQESCDSLSCEKPVHLGSTEQGYCTKACSPGCPASWKCGAFEFNDDALCFKPGALKASP